LPGGTGARGSAAGRLRVGRGSAAGRPRVGCPLGGHIGRIGVRRVPLNLETARIDVQVRRRSLVMGGDTRGVGRNGLPTTNGRPNLSGMPTWWARQPEKRLTSRTCTGIRADRARELRRPLHSPANRSKYAPDIYSTDHARSPRKRIHRPPKRHGHASIAGNAQGDVRGRVG
jgi:hypothetical protein